MLRQELNSASAETTTNESLHNEITIRANILLGRLSSRPNICSGFTSVNEDGLHIDFLRSCFDETLVDQVIKALTGTTLINNNNISRNDNPSSEAYAVKLSITLDIETLSKALSVAISEAKEPRRRPADINVAPLPVAPLFEKLHALGFGS